MGGGFYEITHAQKWIDLLNPEYNLSPLAGSSKGFKHSLESKDKMRIAATGRKHTEEVKDLMRAQAPRQGLNNSFYDFFFIKKNIKHTLLRP